MKVSDFKQRVANKLFMTNDAISSDNDMTAFGYADKIGPTFNECMVLIANGTLACRKAFDVVFTENAMTYDLPKSVLSVLYADTEVKGATFYMLTDHRVKVTKPGSYTFVCNCYYSDVDFNDDSNEFPDDIPESVITIAVLYVASQLLYDTDQVKAAQLRNEFELALARLDIDRQDLQEHFSIVSRW